MPTPPRDRIQKPDVRDLAHLTKEEQDHVAAITERIEAAEAERAAAWSELLAFVNRDRPQQRVELAALQEESQRVKAKLDALEPKGRKLLGRMKQTATKVIRISANQIPQVPQPIAEDDAMRAGLRVYKTPDVPKHPYWKELRRHVKQIALTEYAKKPSPPQSRQV